MRASTNLVHLHCQPLHVQSSSDDSGLLTTLTTPRQAHQGGGRRRGPGRERAGDGKTRQWSQIRRGVRGLSGSGASWGCSRRRIAGGVEGCSDGLAGGGVVLCSEAC
jgi:hypothetical protein